MTTTNRIDVMLSPGAIQECRNPQVAEERARALLHGTAGGPTAGYLEEYAFMVLRCYLLAAALSGSDAAQIRAWADRDDPAPARVLEDNAAQVPDDWSRTLKAGLPTAGFERSTILATVRYAIRSITLGSVG